MEDGCSSIDSRDYDCDPIVSLEEDDDNDDADYDYAPAA